jgi:NADPH:quinone reductase-like Zn-dependent oxidoreductase
MGGFKTDEFNILPFLLKRVQIIGTTLRSRKLEYKINLTKNFRNDFLSYFDKKILKSNVDQVFKIDQINQAHQYMKDNKNKGKIVISWDD